MSRAEEDLRRAIERLRPKPGSGIDSMTMTMPGRGGARMNADGSNDKICKHDLVESECPDCGGDRDLASALRDGLDSGS